MTRNDGDSDLSNTPETDALEAWRTLLEGPNASYHDHLLLLKRGKRRYRYPDPDPDGEKHDYAALFRDVDYFSARALEQPTRDEVREAPSLPVNEPGRIALIAGLSAMQIKQHPILQDQGPEPKAHHEVYDLATKHIITGIHSGGEVDSRTLRLAAANMVYDRRRADMRMDERGPPAGKPVVDIVQGDIAGREDIYFEIPLTWANKRLHFTRDGNRNDTDADVTCRIAKNNVYVPVSDFDSRLESWLTKASKGTNRNTDGPLAVMHKVVSQEFADARGKLLDRAHETEERLERLEELGQHDRLWFQSGYQKKEEAILKAVEAHPQASFNEWVTAAQLYEVVSWYANTEDGFFADIASEFSGQKSISRVLAESDNPDIETQKRDGQANLFRLEYAPYGQSKQVTINEPGDIEELPCMDALTDHLHEGKPTRFMLFTLVRILIDLGFSNEEINDYYSQFPWYDERKTSYQTDYERRQTESGGGAVPISCNNDNKQFSQFCIGRDNCEYSIYGSLPFPESVYERVGDGSDSGGFVM